MTGPHHREPDHRYVPYPTGGGSVRPARRSSRGRIALIVIATISVVLLVVGFAVIGTMVISRTVQNSAAASTRTSLALPARTTTQPSVTQVHRNRILTKTLATPTACTLPTWSTDFDAMQAFADAANLCFGAVWGSTLPRVTLFDTPDDHPPASTGCPTTERTPGFWVCLRGSASNYPSMVRSAGNQSGSGIEWLARIAVTRVATDSGQRADLRALVASVGGPTSPLGTEYLRRESAQEACLTGATLGMLVDHGISVAELESAAAATALWFQLDDTRTIDGDVLTTWFQRGAAVRTTAPCGDAWSAPVGELP
ncbi:hypothetical protein AXK57_21365 [Tsukamurella pulmonis]|uniref:Uncharacterized protein n=1 Tax=Tsukamurella pulmonis TaxID=47312 RepID=A0A1H1HT15_9ACTN|nr:hypothetical protein [Tsukamurella pulmonis]KXO94400.1 hypothetical protein AXK56_17225 [Tsukamurella pulmonis]KXP11800.1 hypothetical protein AXK57_21365 [Tsukamurella pulmonis]RDH13641.1 hypothetical protein DVB88_01375 [Tsukamurella pulmonis]SDR28554.1 hypothetical protein SAMN04489765_4558 [Tsukamurella pulmonis]SUP13287.1 Uncharacterised protein [Tsukamurella pulmonis]